MPDSRKAEVAQPTDGPIRRPQVKQKAVELLLDWGFSPSVIATLVGCETEWIAAIQRTRTS